MQPNPSQSIAVTRSEERAVTGTERVAAETIRFGKRVVTEERTVTITVRREEFFFERLPVEVGDPAAGRHLDAAAPRTVSVLLREEVPVVSATMRPVERVTVAIEAVQDTADVSVALAHEQVEVDLTDQAPGA